MPILRIGNVDFPYVGTEPPAWLRTMAEAGSTGVTVTGAGELVSGAPAAAPTAAAPTSVGPTGEVPSNLVPPAPGAVYAGMDASGQQIIWRMPDGSMRRTNAQGAEFQPGTTQPALPSAPLPQPAPSGSVTIGEAEDYKAAADQALRQLGIVNVERSGLLTDADIDRFALAKMDMEAIAAYYSRTPEVQAVNPGAELGLSREEYFRQREAHEEAFEGRFGPTGTLEETRRRARKPEEQGAALPEPAWLQEVFREGFTPEGSAQLFGDYFKRTGRAPSAEEIGRYRTRSQQVFGGRVVEPSYTPPHLREERGERPKASELGPRERGRTFGRLR